MRILHTLAPAPMGGLEEVVLRLTAGLRERGHSVAAAVVRGQGTDPHPMEKALGAAGIHLFSIPVPGRGYFRERRMLAEIIEAWSPDLLHSHGYRPDVVHPGMARRAGIPTVSTLHGFTGGGWKNRIYEGLQLRSVRSLDGVVAVSGSMVPRLRAAGISEDRIHIIPNAWSDRDPTLSNAEARLHLGVGANHRHIGWVGRLSREKGADIFLAALALLPDLEFEASVIGEGPLAPELARRAGSLGGRAALRLQGAIPRAGRLFPGFDLFVLSSRTEGTPIVLLEAMAAGVPIVATAVGGVPDLLQGECALLVAPDDPQALAEAIREALADRPASAARAVRARERLQGEYAEGPWIERHEALYASLCANHPVPR